LFVYQGNNLKDYSMDTGLWKIHLRLSKNARGSQPLELKRAGFSPKHCRRPNAIKLQLQGISNNLVAKGGQRHKRQ
jgi:hypothetical protein